MRFWRSSSAMALALVLCGCASTDLGYDSWTGTTVTPTRRGRADYRVDCGRGTAYCLERAEAVCGGPYRIIGQPSLSPRVQAVVHWQITTVNTDNPTVIYVACG